MEPSQVGAILSRPIGGSIMEADMQELAASEIDSVNGGVVYWGVRAGVGAVVGGAVAVTRELQGDGLSWADWDEVAVGAGIGAAAGLLGGWVKRLEK